MTEIEENFDNQIKEIEEKTLKRIEEEENKKKEFIILNQTIVTNELRSKKILACHKNKEDIATSELKMSVNSMNIKKMENEAVNLKARKMIYKFKLKEMYIDLMQNPDKLL